jgi:hypothetical protein
MAAIPPKRRAPRRVADIGEMGMLTACGMGFDPLLDVLKARRSRHSTRFYKKLAKYGQHGKYDTYYQHTSLPKLGGFITFLWVEKTEPSE